MKKKCIVEADFEYDAGKVEAIIDEM